jgi:hypothetical protein
MDFPFHQVYGLDDYNDENIPAVFFGMYRFEDYRLWLDNISRKTKIFWTGQDALDFDWSNKLLCDNNRTAHPKIYNLIKSKGTNCQLVKPAAWGNEVDPQVLGKKIYAYCPSSAPDYHGKKIIEELRCGGYEILIGDGQWTQDQWRKWAGDEHYKDCFIGLCLSEFAGGGGSIIEMGLRGMKVVTNVFDLPNCVPWNSIQDVVQAIEDETQYIGMKCTGIADRVWDDLDHEYKWLEI